MSETLINGVPGDRIAVNDRGFQYGDGLFETLLMVDGRSPWWERHMARLQLGCARLGIAAPDVDLLQEEATRVAGGRPRCAIRISITRGVSERGYGSAGVNAPTRVVAAHPAPIVSTDSYTLGVRARWCETRLGISPALAGIKHMNRLEQVLARAEWHDKSIAEGILRDSDGRVVCATAANLFLLRDGILVTPRIDRAGVAGICRSWVLQHASRPIEERDVSMEDVMAAQELFLTSSLRGVLPVRELDGQNFEPGATARELLLGLRDLGVVSSGQSACP